MWSFDIQKVPHEFRIFQYLRGVPSLWISTPHPTTSTSWSTSVAFPNYGQISYQDRGEGDSLGAG